MTFFKHFTDAHQGRSMMTLMDEMGHAGPACYWILLELCAEKLEKNQDEEFTDAHFRFVFHERVLRERFRLSRTKVERWLNLGSTLDLFSVDISKNEFQITMPKLLECMDRDAKRARQRRDECASPPGLEIEREIEVDKEEERREPVEAIEVTERDERPHPTTPAPEPQAENLSPPPPKFGPRDLAAEWNARMAGVKSVQGRTMPTVDLESFGPKQEERWRASKARLSEKPHREYWAEVIDRIARSEWCRGKGVQGSWLANFDFLLRPKTHIAVMEGQYGCTSRKPVVTPPSQVIPVPVDTRPDDPEERARMMAEVRSKMAKAGNLGCREGSA